MESPVQSFTAPNLSEPVPETVGEARDNILCHLYYRHIE